MKKKLLIFLLFLIFFVSFVLVYKRTNYEIKIEVSESIKGKIVPLIQEFKKEFPKAKIFLVEEDGDFLIDTKGGNFRKSVLIGKEANSFEIYGAGTKRKIGKDINFYLNYKSKKEISDKFLSFLREKLNSKYQKSVSITLLGDIVPARTVYLKMKQNGFDYPFRAIANETKKTDLTFGNFECPITDKIEPPTEGMSFAVPPKVLDGLSMLGLDLVTLANNHSTNFGESAFLETLDNLKNAGIVYVGGGRNYKEAHELKIVEKNGVKIGILNYNSIIGGLKATENSAGVAWLHMPPWADEINQEELAVMKEEIKEARKKVDFLIVAIHWGVEYRLEPIKAQVFVAHQAIDSGADLVWGSHPHVVSTFETYKGKLIIYHLGNFIFDQMWSEETREGIIAKIFISDKKIKKVELVPYKIFDYAQPRVLPGESGKYIIERMLSKSKFE